MQGSRKKQGKAVILTALPVEYGAIRAHLSECQEKEYRGSLYEQGVFSTEEWIWEIGIAQTEAGNATAAFEIERAIAYFQPGVVLFVGVAGGIKDVDIGDVVVATKVYGYESGKAAGERFLPRPDVGESSYSLVQRAQAEARKKDWLQRIRESTGTTPQVFVGPIASGEKVIAATRSEIYRFLQAMYSDALAVEMEARGFLKATHANEHTQALIVRGISDLLNDKSQADASGTQEMSARHASAFAFEILAKLDPTIASPDSGHPSQGTAISSTMQARQDPMPERTSSVALPLHIPDEPYFPLPGREEQLRQLLTAFHNPLGSPAIVIDGLGGLGKTAFAVELARRALQLQLFEKVVGDSAKQEQFSSEGIVRIGEATLDFHTLPDTIARQLDHWEIATLRPEEKLVRMAQLLRQHRYLLIVDNLESVDNAQKLVAELRGFLGGSRALITSRQKVRHDFVLPLSLRGLDQDDALFFIEHDLQQRGGDQLLRAPREKLVEICQVTGGAPLALKLVVAQAMFLDIDFVLRQLKQASDNIYSFIFRQSWEQLSSTAQLILIYIGRTVTTTVSWEELAEIGIAKQEHELRAAVRQLVDYSLLDVYTFAGQVRYGIHQLTRQFINSDLPRLWEA
jgi:nucleoside phosphorylase